MSYALIIIHAVYCLLGTFQECMESVVYEGKFCGT